MTSRETAEDVLREIAERYSGDKMLMHYRDRIERALAGRAEAVAWYAPTIDDTCTNAKKAQRARDGVGSPELFSVPLYTHPPASVPEVTDATLFDDALAAAFEKYPHARDGLTFFACAIQGPRQPTLEEIEWAKSEAAALQEQRHD